MRINPCGSAAASVATERTGSAVSSPDQLSANFTPQDTAKLSSGVDSVFALTLKALQSSEARTSTVETLRQQVQANQYPLDASSIADALSNSSI